MARAAFFNLIGEIRDRGFEQQRYRASGLNLLTTAIVLWNAVYLERAANAVGSLDEFDDALVQYLSPPGWEHINLTGDYTWRNNAKPGTGKLMRLRPIRRSWRTIFSVLSRPPPRRTSETVLPRITAIMGPTFTPPTRWTSNSRRSIRLPPEQYCC